MKASTQILLRSVIVGTAQAGISCLLWKNDWKFTSALFGAAAAANIIGGVAIAADVKRKEDQLEDLL